MQSDIFIYIDSSPPPVVEGGPLTGKAVTVQPNMSVRGWPTAAGSRALEKFVALEDATVVERIRAGGGVIKGSTRMSELGFGLRGDTAARTVTEGLADISIITDTMGEARAAASTNGIFGFKPSYGIVSRFGLIGLVPSMECFGILAGAVEDIAVVMGVIAGPDDRDLSMPECEIPDFSEVSAGKKARVTAGFVREFVETLDPSAVRSFRTMLSELERKGLNIQEVSIPDFELFQTVHNVIGSVEASSSAGKYDGVRYGHRTDSAKNWNEMYLKSRAESFGLLVKSYLFQGAYFQFENYTAFENACRIRRRLLRETDDLFSAADVLVFSTVHPGLDPARADTIRHVYDAFSMTLPASVTGHPAVALPASEDVPGLQLVGPFLSDTWLLSLASRLASSMESGGGA